MKKLFFIREPRFMVMNILLDVTLDIMNQELKLEFLRMMLELILITGKFMVIVFFLMKKKNIQVLQIMSK